MFKMCRGNLLGQFMRNCHSFRRFFLSDAFKCTETWENRLKTPIFQKLQFGNLYSQLDKSFTSGRSINVLDVDIFVNGVVDDSYQNELQDILHKLRSNPETSVMYESTSHAAIRSLLSWNKKEDLLDILSQRLIYGLFPDVYLSILMIDTFIKQDDIISALKIAVLQMLQEDCNHPILKGLSLYSCIKYLNSTDVWVTPKEDVDEDEEIVKVRVDFVRNEYYDDHFDMIDTNHLVGKTMCAFGKTVEGPVGTSLQLIGLILHEKFDQAVVFVSDSLKNNVPIYKEAVEKARSYVQDKPKQLVGSQSEDDTDGKEDKENEVSVETEEESGIKAKLTKLLDELHSKNLLPDPLETVLEQYVNKEVEAHEKNYIQKQCEIYKKWEEGRLKNIEEEMMEEKKRSVKREIEEIQQQLESEERKLFYYDNETEYNEIVEKKKIEMENVHYYVEKNKKKAVQKIGYIPPRITKRST